MVVHRIVVTELEPDPDNPEPWLTEWEMGRGWQRQRHDSKRAAQRLVANLIKESGKSRDEVLTVIERE